MHAVTAKAVAGTVTGLPIRCVPCSKTDEAESAFSLVVLLPLLPFLHWSHSRNRITSHLHHSSSHAIYYHHFAINQFFQAKSSPTCIRTFTFTIDTQAFLLLSFLPNIGLFFRSHYVPCPRRPLSSSPSGFTTCMTHSIIHFDSKIGLDSLDWIQRVRAQHFLLSFSGSYY
jgi:hypothetical protein